MYREKEDACAHRVIVKNDVLFIFPVTSHGVHLVERATGMQ